MTKLKHRPLLRSPYYSDSRQPGAVLHRYLDDQFLSRFASLAQNNQLSQENFSWLDEDRFIDKDNTCLRLPVHRTFYVICCEACCDAPGLPALKPQQVESAGFVIRQQGEAQELRWMVQGGVDKGWQPALNPLTEEPDEYRYLLNKGYTEARSPEPAYSGEQSYPLSSLLVENNASAAGRKHNLLYGFLPLGGQSYPTLQQAQNSSTQVDVLRTIHWPLGTLNAPQADSRDAWSESHYSHSGYIVQNGELQPAAADLIVLLFEQFQLFSTENAENSELIRLLESIHYQWGQRATHPSPTHYESRHSLYHYLKDNAATIENWLAEYHQNDNDIGPANRNKSLYAHFQLFISKQQVTDLQLLLKRRLQGIIELTLSDLPEPRYQREGLYHVRVFMRYRDEKGCLKIIWGPNTIPFRVAAPFDPQASRPHVIQMPGLDDLKRGMASGAALKMPKSLADMVQKIKPDFINPGLREQQPDNETGWIYIFSIPIVTICAMILLMILVSLLNIIFRWIPWVILRIPVPR